MNITLESLADLDPRAPNSYPRRRFLCPVCGDDKPRDHAHRSLDVDVSQGVYVCHRCTVSGRLGAEASGQSYRAPPAPKNAPPQLTWREKLNRSGISALSGTPGECYLERRGVNLRRASACNLVYARSLYRRAAVVFPIRDERGVNIAAQGRHLDRANPRMHTVGAKKFGCFQTPGALQSPRFAVCEAPLDAISLWILGTPAVAVCGSDLTPWLPRVAQGKEVLIASDADEQGDADWETWGAKFRQLRVSVERYRPHEPYKDWNDVLRSLL